MASQSECLAGHLLVQISLQLKDHSAHGQSNSPVVEFTLTLTHTLLIALGVDTDVGADSFVKLVVHASQAPLNCFLRNLQSRSRHSAVVIFHA